MLTPNKIPAGFNFAGVATGVKQSGDLDLALVVANQESVAAGVYTENLIRAASIDWNRSITPSSSVRAIAINSGNANACTGRPGETDNSKIADEVAAAIDASPDQVLVLSTGVIGHRLPMEKVTGGIQHANSCLSPDPASFDAASRAILTTDNGPKTASRFFEVAGVPVKILGMAKGAGMIGPRMATMLSVIITDLKIGPEQAQLALRSAVNNSFNRISVEGHTSTNDAVVLLCSGLSGPSKPECCELFASELSALCLEMAKMIPLDGEGASHLMAIEVSGAADHQEADRIARCVANSNLVKTAVAGNDPNWGRIVSAVGYCPAANIIASQIKLRLNGCLLFDDGSPAKFDARQVSRSMADNRETRIEISLGGGPGQSRHWTSDLTEAYVRFNSEYHT